MSTYRRYQLINDINLSTISTYQRYQLTISTCLFDHINSNHHYHYHHDYAYISIHNCQHLVYSTLYVYSMINTIIHNNIVHDITPGPPTKSFPTKSP